MVSKAKIKGVETVKSLILYPEYKERGILISTQYLG
jgi:hypothetical protein